MILNHQIAIIRSTSTYSWNEELQDNVWETIRYFILTFDMDMRHKDTPRVMTGYVLTLPPPDPKNFIPFKDVTNSVMIKWINDLTPDFTERQARNTEKLMAKYGSELSRLLSEDLANTTPSS